MKYFGCGMRCQVRISQKRIRSQPVWIQLFCLIWCQHGALGWVHKHHITTEDTTRATRRQNDDFECHSSYKQAKECNDGSWCFWWLQRSIYSYYHRYHQVIEKIKNATEKAHLVAIEQRIMYETCVETPGLCFVIRPEQRWERTPALKYPMFYMLAFLNSVEYQYMKERGLVQKHFGDYTAPWWYCWLGNGKTWWKYVTLDKYTLSSCKDDLMRSLNIWYNI